MAFSRATSGAHQSRLRPLRERRRIVPNVIYETRSHKSVFLQLLQISAKVSLSFRDRIASEFFQRAAGQSQRDHGFARHSSSRYNADVGTLVRGLDRLAGGKIDRLQRSPQSRNRLDISANPNLFAV